MVLDGQLEGLAPVSEEDRVRLVRDEKVDFRDARRRLAASAPDHLRHDAIATFDDGGDALLGEVNADGSRAGFPITPPVRGSRFHVSREVAVPFVDERENG